MVRHVLTQEQIRRRDGIKIGKFMNDFRSHNDRIITPRVMTRQHYARGDVKSGASIPSGLESSGVDLVEIFGHLEPGD
jgi:hypothetical protein